MAKVVFFIDGVFTSFCGGKFKCVPLHWGFHITLLAFQELTHNIYVISINTLFVPPCPILRIHTKSTFEKGDLLGFGLELIVIWEFSPCL
jgi:hypothetical protein